jgi:hypothetical protein
MHGRKASELVNAFSQKSENLEAAIALHYADYSQQAPSNIPPHPCPRNWSWEFAMNLGHLIK